MTIDNQPAPLYNFCARTDALLSYNKIYTFRSASQPPLPLALGVSRNSYLITMPFSVYRIFWAREMASRLAQATVCVSLVSVSVAGLLNQAFRISSRMSA